jgi:hypothetical protein
MANPATAKAAGIRGEVAFKVGAIEFTARANFLTVATLEAELNQSVLQLSSKARAFGLSYTEIVRIVEVAARTSDKPPKATENLGQFREDIFQAGPLNFMPQILELLTAVFETGRPESTEKNAEAGRMKKS